MPSITYFIRFAHRVPTHSAPYEEQEHTNLADAWESFRLFAEPDSAEMYSQIELVEYDYTEATERLIARMEFGF